MSQSEISQSMNLVNAVFVRAASDPDLRARLLADPRTTLALEAGLTIPGDWDLVAREAPDGTVGVELANGDIPEEYLDLVSGAGSECQSGMH